MAVAWPYEALNELYRNVGTDLTPGTVYFLQRSNVPSMAMCSAVCLDDPACIGFVFSAVAFACTTLQGSLANVLASTTEAQGHNIYWKGGSLSYTNWTEGEPNDLLSEDCAVVGELGGWNDISCSLLRTYVCEVAQEHCDTGKWDIRCTYV